MHYVFFTEELSAEVALRNIIPKIIDTTIHTFQILSHNGKNDLISKLNSTLPTLASMIDDGYVFVVLIDKDENDCKLLKQELEQISFNAGIPTKTNPGQDGNFYLVNRINNNELESWFLGDPDAIKSAYPDINMSTFENKKYKNPDSIREKGNRVLERILRRASYFRAGLAKIEAARNISLHMNPQANTCQSFNCFVDGIRNL